MSWLEETAKAYQNSIQAVVALGTWAAIASSLWMARTSSKPKLNIRVDVASESAGSYFQSRNLEDFKNFRTMFIEIQNIGNVPAYLHKSSFKWKVPWFRTGWLMQNPPTYDERHMRIEPGQQMIFTLAHNAIEVYKQLEIIEERSACPKFLRGRGKLEVRLQSGQRISTGKGVAIKYQLKNWRSL